MRKIFCILILFSFFPVRGQDPSYPAPSWQIRSPRYPTNNVIVAGYSVLDFGAKGDGVTDDTHAFREALSAMRHHGGGVIFVPEGKYLLTGPLVIYENVVLRGEWKAPDENGIHGTLLIVKTGKGNEKGSAFITLHRCAGVKELNIWYPEQDTRKVVAYPWCIHQPGEENGLVERVTLVNPYLGIQIGPQANALHYIHEVYGTPLKTGLLFDRCFDIGRLEGIRFQPEIWSRSALPGAPAIEEITEWTRKNGTALVMYRSDWEYGYDVRVKGYRVGFEISGSPEFDLESGAPEAYPNAQFYDFTLTDCEKAVLVKGANPYGIAFTRSQFHGTKVGFETAETFNSVIQFHDCRFEGQHLLRNNGNGHVALQHCRIGRGEVVLFDGTVTILDSDIEASSLYCSSRVQQAELLGNRIDLSCTLVYDQNNSRIKIGPAPVSFRPLPDMKPAPDMNCRPGKETLYVVTAAPYNADPHNGNDSAPAVQKAIDDAAAKGGGIVFFPPGDYRLGQNLILKEGVELRGISDGPHHAISGGTILHVCTGKGKKDPPFIRMKSRSGIQGVLFHYPDQHIYKVAPYPFLIRGEGENLYLVNVSATNPYRMVDLATFRCDGHYLSYVAGAPLSVGLRVGGGSVGGCIKNTQFNPSYWAFAKFDNAPRYGVDLATVWHYENKNLDAMILGDVKEQVMFQNFVFGSLYGIHLVAENGRGPSGYIHGHGSDGAEISAFIECVGNNGVSFVNTQLVTVLANQHYYIHFDPGQGKSLAFFNTLFWGTPVEAVLLKSGCLDVQLANFHKSGRFGFQVVGGKLYLANAYFWNSSRFIRMYPGAPAPMLAATLYRDPQWEFPPELEIRPLTPTPPLPDVRLADLEYLRASDQLAGAPKKNRSIRNNPLTIAGKVYEHGLGVHAPSEVTYAVKPDYKRFVAVAGLDDEILTYKNYRNTMVIFQVWSDDTLAAESPEMTMEENRIWHVDVPLPAGTSAITLKVIGFKGVDHANWINAGFCTSDKPQPKADTEF